MDYGLKTKDYMACGGVLNVYKRLLHGIVWGSGFMFAVGRFGNIVRIKYVHLLNGK
jgi:hypothetical protein